MNLQSILCSLVFGAAICCASCSKGDEPGDSNPTDPNPTDTTSTNPRDTTTTTLGFPANFVFKNTFIPDNEYYQVMASGSKKVSEPEYMKFSKNILSLTMKDEHTIPFKEITFHTKDRMRIVYKDGTVTDNAEYNILNNKDVHLKSSGYLGSFSSDNSLFYLNLTPYSYSNESNRPIYPRLYVTRSYSSDKNQTIQYLIVQQSLASGDTLAINFTQMIYEKK
jgi:hypothetical protein